MSLLTFLADRLQHDPSAQRARARWHLLDWFGCAIGARGSKLAECLQTLGTAPASVTQRTLLGTTVSTDEALRVHGALGNVLEMDDVHRTSILHPGPIVVPAALSVALQTDAMLDTLLDGVTRGYEAVIRVGRALDAAHYRYFHTTSTAGAFGAAAAAASVLGLDRDRTAHALALAGTRTGGLWQVRHGGMGKSWHNALAAESGVAAAHWAQAGVLGPLALLEGPQGLFAATCTAPRPDRITEDAPWWIDDVSFKPWPACRHAHAVIDAALEVRCALAQRSPMLIATIRIGTYEDALRFCDCVRPGNENEARFSLQHCAAVVLALGRPEALHFREPFLADPRLQRLREITAVGVGQRFAADYPDHYGAEIEVTLQDGQALGATVSDALGDPQNPLDLPALIEKAATLITDAGVADRAASNLIDRLLHAPGDTKVATLYREVLQCID